MKRFLILIYILVSCIVMHAQSIGSWQVYPSYMIATSHVNVGPYVYGLMNGNLLRYDTEDQSVRTYNCIDDLNDVRITHIAYCSDAKKLVITYDNSNIDIMDLDDNVVNISVLKDNNISDKDINNICVIGNTAYICTNFGFLEVDVQECVIQNTYKLGENITGVVTTDDVTYIATNNGIYACGRHDNMHIRDNWTLIYKNPCRQLFTKNGLLYFMVYDWLIELNPETLYTNGKNGIRDLFGIYHDNLVYSDNAGGISVGPEVNDCKHYDIGETINYATVSGGTMWVSEDMNGLKAYKMKDDGLEPIISGIQPNSPIRDLAENIYYVGDRLLVAGGLINYYGVSYPGTAMYYEDGVWTNFDEKSYKEQYPNILHHDFIEIVQDPKDASHHFVGTHRHGLYEFRDGKFVKLYNHTNSPIRDIYNYGPNYVSADGLKYDQSGNLWILNSETDTLVRVWDANGKWHAIYHKRLDCISTGYKTYFTSSGVNFIVSLRLEGHMGFFGFVTDEGITKFEKSRMIDKIKNQDGNEYNPIAYTCMAEDHDGRVWCGTSSGLFVINDPTTFFDSDFSFEQVKINRNDGSGLADYLLKDVSIEDIVIDAANRKWIATTYDGIYLISADGTEMIHHFTTDNSPLLDDNVRSIAIHQPTGLVMMGTAKGLCSYMSDAIEAEDALEKSNVLSFPNPVRPDYNGPITIRGLVQDTEVKICTSTGQLVWSGHSLGGQCTWNGRNNQGRRVASGIYNVIATTPSGNKAVVTRIAIVK